jgi:glycosyltransferase involved in cell wall biosynthesis
MKVAAYAHLHRTREPTGVGQHLIEMIGGLWHAPEIDLCVLAPRHQLNERGEIPADNPLAGIPARGLPASGRLLEGMWERFDWPKVDRWCRGADWVYTPSEAYIAAAEPKLAVTVHDLHAFETGLPWSNTPEHQIFMRRWTRMFRPIIKRADCLLASSEFTRRRLIELLGAKAERIAVVGNGVAEIFFGPSTDDRFVDSMVRPYIVVVGGLTRRKGGDLVLRTAEVLQQELPELRILVAGAGEAEFYRAAAALPNVALLGFVETPQLVSLLRGAFAMLFLSRYEGFGIPAVEAMAAGTPVITSRFGALPEVVGDAGLLVDAENPAEVAASIKDLLADDTGRRDLIARGRARAEGYRWGACVERLLAVLREWRS